MEKTASHPLAEDELRALRSHLAENLMVLAASIFVAVLLAQSDLFRDILTKSAEFKYISSFVAGIFFTSIFTAAPATVAFGELAQSDSILWIALIGGAGAVIGDLVLFKVLKNHLTDELVVLFSHPRRERFSKVFHLRIFHWLAVFIGAIVIASPLPDEAGIILMGLTKLTPKQLIPISYILNALGIAAVGLVAKQLL